MKFSEENRRKKTAKLITKKKVLKTGRKRNEEKLIALI
jgi:hypothetical protein